MKGLEYLIKLNDKLSATADKIVGKAKTLGSSLSGLTDKINKLDVTSRSSGGLQNFGNKISSIIPSANAVKTAVVGAAIGLGIYANSVVDTSLKIDNAERVIAFASGAEGARNIAFLNKEIEDLNLPVVQATQSFSKVTATFKDTVLAGEPMRQIFDGVATAASGMNLSGETSEGVFLAIGQIMSKSKVSAEELVGQLGERLPNALGIASRAMGVSTQQLMKMMENGELMAVDFLPRFAAELKRTFQGAALQAKLSAQGIFTGYQNAMTMLKIELGKTLLPVLTSIAQKVTPLIKEVTPVIVQFLSIVGSFFGDIYDKILEVGNGLAQYRYLLTDIWNTLGELFNLFKTIAIDLLDMMSKMDPEILMQLALGFHLIVGILQKLWVILKPVVQLFLAIAGWIAKRLLMAINDALVSIDWFVEKIGVATTAIQNFLSNIGLIDGAKAEVEVVKKVKTLTPGALKPDGLLNMGVAPNEKPKGLASMPPASSGKVGNTSKEITGGGSRPVNINITVDSIIKGGFTINTTSVKEGASAMREIIEEELLKMLNGANQLAGA